MIFLRILAFPFALLYDVITSLRNLAYDKGWLRSKTYDIPLICVGNLSVGGTGKSPMIAYLASLLKDEYKVGILSRGYGRKTKGYQEVQTDSTAAEVGDEPLQIKQNFPNLKVVVCEDRRSGIEKMKSAVDVILLDDAFQHRRVKAGFNILLTAFDDLYVDDYLLPMGRLRESRAGARRADMIVVSKCPEKVPYAKLQEIQFILMPEPNQKVYFSRIGYGNEIIGKSETQPLTYLRDKPFVLVTGIAKPEPLVEYLQSNGYSFRHQRYPDHHDFKSSELEKLKKEEIILTTEKDYMRLQARLEKFALYYLPIKTLLHNEQQDFFEARIRDAVKEMRKS